jgi:hypothetical protein
MQIQYSTGAALSASGLMFGRHVSVKNACDGSGADHQEPQPFEIIQATLLVRRFGLTESVATVVAQHAFSVMARR